MKQKMMVQMMEKSSKETSMYAEMNAKKKWRVNRGFASPFRPSVNFTLFRDRQKGLGNNFT